MACRILSVLSLLCCALSSISAPPLAHVEVLKAFARGGNGMNGGLIDGDDGFFYGATYGGGQQSTGVIFRFAPGQSIETVGSIPSLNQESFRSAEIIRATDGNFYGIVCTGYPESGSLFRMSPAGVSSEVARYNNAPANGLTPGATGLVQGIDGALYISARTGGSNGNGAVVRVDLDGNISVPIDFGALPAGTPNVGTNPEVGLARLRDGSLVGVTAAGGAHGNGAVFRFDADGLSLIAALPSEADGNRVSPLVEAADGTLYGSARGQSSEGSYFPGGNNGSIYSVSPAGTVMIVHQFVGTAQGAVPKGRLLLDASGNLYGATYHGAVVFRINASGFSVAGDFAAAQAATQGITRPEGGFVLDESGSLFGVMNDGGNARNGAIWKLTTDGAVSVAAQLSTPDGFSPAGLALGSDGSLYGTTLGGGEFGTGTFFRLSNAGAWEKLRDLPSGVGFSRSLVRAGDGLLYGLSGTSVYRVQSSGLTHIAGPAAGSPGSIFSSTGGRLLCAADGRLWGMARGGGFATIVSASIDGSSYWTRSTGSFLASDLALNSAGQPCYATPYRSPTLIGPQVRGRFYFGSDVLDLDHFSAGSPVHASDGNLYGIGSQGLDGSISFPQPTVFYRVTPAGEFQSVHSSPPEVGFGGVGPLLEAKPGVFFAFSSRISRVDTASGSAPVAELAYDTHGSNPVDSLSLGPDGQLYGCTTYAGPGNGGTIFRLRFDTGAETLQPFDVRAAFATLAGEVCTGGTAGTAWIEYGSTVSYGQASPVRSVGAKFSEPVSLKLEGLTPAQSFHYRVVMSVGSTVYMGHDAVFTTPPNTPPYANSFGLPTGVGTPVEFSVHDHATDYEDGTVALVALGSPTRGVVENLGGGRVRYTAAEYSDLGDQFTYTVRDVLGAESTATVNIQFENTIVTLAPTGISQTDATLQASLWLRYPPSDPSQGVTFEFSIDGGVVFQSSTQLISAAGLTECLYPIAVPGGSKCRYRARYDFSYGSPLLGEWVEFTGAQNTPPIAVNDEVELDPFGARHIDPRANDSDPDGDAIWVDSVTSPPELLASFDQNGVFLQWIDPKAGSSTISYTIRDAWGLRATGSILVQNPFLALRGAYRSALIGPRGFAGEILLKVNQLQSCTGTVRIGAEVASIRGGFAGNTYTAQVQFGAKTMTLTLNILEGGHLSGTLADGSTTYTIQPDARPVATATRGVFNAAFTAPGSGALGHGWARINIESTGAARLAGRLPNGLPFTRAGWMRVDGSLPIYYGHGRANGPANILNGTLQFTAPPNECTGAFQWRYAAAKGTSSFDTALQVSGARYAKVRSGEFAQVQVRVTAGSLSKLADIPSPTAGTVLEPGPDKLTLRIDPITGIFRGRYMNGGPVHRYDGVLIGGYSHGRGVSWRVTAPTAEVPAGIADYSSPEPVTIEPGP